MATPAGANKIFFEHLLLPVQRTSVCEAHWKNSTLPKKSRIFFTIIQSSREKKIWLLKNRYVCFRLLLMAMWTNLGRKNVTRTKWTRPEMYQRQNASGTKHFGTKIYANRLSGQDVSGRTQSIGPKCITLQNVSLRALSMYREEQKVTGWKNTRHQQHLVVFSEYIFGNSICRQYAQFVHAAE